MAMFVNDLRGAALLPPGAPGQLIRSQRVGGSRLPAGILRQVDPALKRLRRASSCPKPV